RPQHHKHSLGTAIVITRPKHSSSCKRPQVSVTAPDGKTKETFGLGKTPSACSPPSQAKAPKKHHQHRKHHLPGDRGHHPEAKPKSPTDTHPGAHAKPHVGTPAGSRSDKSAT